MFEIVSKYGFVLFLKSTKKSLSLLKPETDIGKIITLIWQNQIEEAINEVSKYVGSVYRYIEGVIHMNITKKYDLAMKAYLEAGEYAPAICNIGCMYIIPLGVEKDLVKGYTYINKSASLGYAMAFVNQAIEILNNAEDKYSESFFSSEKYNQIVSLLDRAIELDSDAARIRKAKLLGGKYSTSSILPSYEELQSVKELLLPTLDSEEKEAAEIIDALTKTQNNIDENRLRYIIEHSNGITCSITDNLQITIKIETRNNSLAREFKTIIDRNPSLGDKLVKAYDKNARFREVEIKKN